MPVAKVTNFLRYNRTCFPAILQQTPRFSPFLGVCVLFVLFFLSNDNMKITHHLILSALFLLAFSGCNKAENPTTPNSVETETPDVETKPETEVTASPSTTEEPQVEEEPTLPEEKSPYSEEQEATARSNAEGSGIVMKENDLGQVILIDTAANRAWVDNYQMQEVLVFPTSLQTLVVEGPSISDELADRIAEHNKLTSLTMRNTLISEAGLEKFKSLSKLKAIDLRLSPLLTAAVADLLVQMPELRAVRLNSVNINDESIKTLVQLPKLSELDLRNCFEVTAEGFKHLQDKKSLRTLKIGGSNITDEVLELISQFDQLTTLSLDNTELTNYSTHFLASLPLTNLTLYQGASLSDEGLGFLSQMKSLTRLTVRDIRTNGAFLATLPAPEKLTDLNIAQTTLGDEQAQALSKMTNLKRLIVNQTAITDKTLEVIMNLKSLQKVEMTQTDISSEAVTKLREALPDCEIRKN